jgi:MipA family protein
VKAFFLLFLTAWPSFALEKDLPLWELGLGVGGLFFQDYPASNESNVWMIPVPTFQYRGEILRADEREGARAYLLKSSDWSLELGANGLPNVNSEKNEARQGMSNIPWGVQLGPQFVAHFAENYKFKLGFYQAISTDFDFTKQIGVLSEIELERLFDNNLSSIFNSSKSHGRLSFSIFSGSKEFLANYYEVSQADSLVNRAYYESRAGLLNYEISYFQALEIRPWSFFVGISSEHYDISANRKSPLHKTDQNFKGFIGLTYLIYESKTRGVPENQAEGAIPKIKNKL